MPLTDLQQLRLRAADPERTFQEEFVGDGSALIYDLSHVPVVSGSATVTVAGAAQTDPTHYSLAAATGRVTFVTAPANTARVLVYGRSTIWSDDELNDILGRRGNVRDSLLECALILMGDGARRGKWATNQGLSVDDSTIARTARDWYEALKADQLDAAFGSGGAESWAANQEDF